jgi:hypothetical protein
MDYANEHHPWQWSSFVGLPVKAIAAGCMLYNCYIIHCSLLPDKYSGIVDIMKSP